MELVDINLVKTNPNNPRFIKDYQFNKLVKSLKDFPQMMQIRPIVVNQDMVILGGNMRYRAAKEAGWSEIPIEVVDLPEDKQREFTIKDNVGFGDWDWEILANEWDSKQLEEWGLEGEWDKEQEDKYTRDIIAPTYEPVNEKPSLDTLANKDKATELVTEINESDIPEAEKEFLKLAAFRHIVFDYSKIADYYAHSSAKVQELMEKSALVIIDFKQAIESGYTALTQEINEIESEDYGD